MTCEAPVHAGGVYKHWVLEWGVNTTKGWEAISELRAASTGAGHRGDRVRHLDDDGGRHAVGGPDTGVYRWAAVAWSLSRRLGNSCGTRCAELAMMLQLQNCMDVTLLKFSYFGPCLKKGVARCVDRLGRTQLLSIVVLLMRRKRSSQFELQTEDNDEQLSNREVTRLCTPRHLAHLTSHDPPLYW